MSCDFAVLGKVMENKKKLMVGVPLKVIDGWLTSV
jgi:hypothetical protein